MTLLQKIRYNLVCLLLLVALSACGSSTPTPAAVNTDTPAPELTSTLAPTDTPALTLTSTQPAQSPTPNSGAGASNETPEALTQTPGANDQAASGGSSPASGTAGQTAKATSTAPAVAAQPPSGSSAADKYQFLGQDVADHSQFLPNRVVTVTWTVKNIGTTGWTKDYALRYFSGPKPDKDIYYFTKDVPVEGTINFVVSFTTPADPGNYDLWFKLTNQAGQNFGDVDLVFTVSTSPQKATSTPTK